MRKEEDRRRRVNESDDAPEWEPSATPFELRPVELRQEPIREIRPLEFGHSEMPAVSFEDRGPDARPVIEHRYDATEFQHKPVELRREESRDIPMLSVPISDIAMRSLAERRVQARDLGWNVPGWRIRPPRPD